MTIDKIIAYCNAGIMNVRPRLHLQFWSTNLFSSPPPMFCRKLMGRPCFYSTCPLFRNVWTWSWAQLSNCVTTLNESSWHSTSSLPAESVLLPARGSSWAGDAIVHCVYPSPSPKKKKLHIVLHKQIGWLHGVQRDCWLHMIFSLDNWQVSQRVTGVLSACLLFFAFEEWRQTPRWKIRSIQCLWRFRTFCFSWSFPTVERMTMQVSKHKDQ